MLQKPGQALAWWATLARMQTLPTFYLLTAELCLYKSQAHVANYCTLRPSTDVEKKPGPRLVYVDPSKTIAAPYMYTQGNWTKCRSTIVAKSLWSEIYNKKGINSMNDLIQIMSILNQLYLSLQCI